MNIDDYIMCVNSSNLIVERDKKSFNQNYDDYIFYYNNILFNEKVEKNVLLPINSYLLFSDKTKILFTKNFNLYKYDFLKKESEEVILENFKIISLKPLNNDSTLFLSVGQKFENNIYKIGFYIIDIVNRKISCSKELFKEDNFSVSKYRLKLSGKYYFSDDQDKLAYCCDKSSKIYFFDVNGFFIKEVYTNENSPMPSIIKSNSNIYYYSRLGTWNINMGMFFCDKKVYMFSGSTTDFEKIIIDEYNYSDFKYLKSYKLSYNNQNCRNIRNVFVEKNRIVLCFEFYYASFIF